jgi:hypothetical protein
MTNRHNPLDQTQQLADWARQAEAQANQLRADQAKTTAAAERYAKDPELRADAKARRQAAARASLGAKALGMLENANNVLHHGSEEIARRLLPQPSEDAGYAMRERVQLDQILALEHGQQAQEFREDAEARRLLFASGTKYDIRKVAENPLVDVKAMRQQVIKETNPPQAELLENAQQAQRDLLRVAGRAVGQGVTGQPIELDGLVSPTARQAGDVARRYANLGPGWKLEQDGVSLADRTLMEGKVGEGLESAKP